MSVVQIAKKGYIPLGSSGPMSLSIQGKLLNNFWMWTGQVTEYEDGTKQIRTSQVRELREAALHYYKDGWIPVKPVTDDMLRAFEVELRNHRGLQGVPDKSFLEKREVPSSYIMAGEDVSGKTVKSDIPEGALEAIKKARGG